MKSTLRGKRAIIEGGGARLTALSLLFSATFFFSRDTVVFFLYLPKQTQTSGDGAAARQKKLFE